MNSILLPVLCSLHVVAFQPSPTPQATIEKSAVRAVVKANTEFAVDLHQQLRQEPGNFCFSPWSISTVLTMTTAGARERTLEQMVKTLHLPDAQLTHPGSAALLRQMKSQRGYELNAANAMFVGSDLSWRKDFLDLTRKHYGSSIFSVDYLKQPESARQSINAWVEGQTRKRIANLIPKDGVKSASKIVLVNAIYFKGEWDKPFNKRDTTPSPFFRTPSDKILAPMMSQSGAYLYGENRDVQMLGVIYKGNDLMMVFVLPRERNGLPALEKDLTATILQGWLERLEIHPTVDVYLPRFKITYQLDLASTLARLGMSDLFGPNSNLSGMTDSKYPLKVDSVIHKAFLELQEEGTEAAAATAVEAVVGAPPGRTFTPPPPRPIFRADHPFLFGIVDRRSGSLLFMGRVSDPTK